MCTQIVNNLPFILLLLSLLSSLAHYGVPSDKIGPNETLVFKVNTSNIDIKCVVLYYDTGLY